MIYHLVLLFRKKNMEIFKTEELKKEYKEYQQLLKDVFDCSFCQIFSCKYHKKFDMVCNLCREVHCKKCKKLLLSIEILTDSCDEVGKDFIYDFTKDFLNLDNLTLDFFNIEINKKIKIEKELFKKKVKSEKNSTKTIKQKLPSGVKNGQYQIGRRKRHYYY